MLQASTWVLSMYLEPWTLQKFHPPNSQLVVRSRSQQNRPPCQLGKYTAQCPRHRRRSPAECFFPRRQDTEAPNKEVHSFATDCKLTDTPKHKCNVMTAPHGLKTALKRTLPSKICGIRNASALEPKWCLQASAGAGKVLDHRPCWTQNHCNQRRDGIGSQSRPTKLQTVHIQARPHRAGSCKPHRTDDHRHLQHASTFPGCLFTGNDL